MVTTIREEGFLVNEVEIVYDYTHYNKATATNTLPAGYQKNADTYNKINNKHYVGVWDDHKQHWQTVAVPPYAENVIYCGGEDAEVMDVYDMDSGTYKRRGAIKCDICLKDCLRTLYVVRNGGVLHACSFECVENLRRCEEAETEADNIIKNAQEKKKPKYTERRFNPAGDTVYADMAPYACRICGKVPVDMVQAMVGVHEEGTPEDDTLYSLTCSLECALKFKEEHDKRKLTS